MTPDIKDIPRSREGSVWGRIWVQFPLDRYDIPYARTQEGGLDMVLESTDRFTLLEFFLPHVSRSGDKGLDRELADILETNIETVAERTEGLDRPKLLQFSSQELTVVFRRGEVYGFDFTHQIDLNKTVKRLIHFVRRQYDASDEQVRELQEKMQERVDYLRSKL